MGYSTTYWTFRKGKPRTSYLGEPCFSAISYNHYGADKVTIDAVRYMLPPDPMLTDAEVDFWVKFLKATFTTARFKTRKVVNKFGRKLVYFVLDTSKMGRVERLAYLTAFRYPDEYPEIVQRTMKACMSCDGDIPVDHSPAKWWDKFQDVMRASTGLKNKNLHVGGHSLTCTYYDTGVNVPLDKFLQRLKDTAYTSVNSLFNN